MTKKNHSRRLAGRLAAIGSSCLAGVLAFALVSSTYGGAAFVDMQVTDALREEPVAIVAEMADVVGSADAEAYLPQAAGDDSAGDVTAPATNYAALSQSEYADNTVLISVENEQDIDSARALVANADGLGNATLSTEDASLGFVTLTYDGSVSAGALADQLQAQGLAAQPNFKYYALDIDEEEAISSLADEAGDADGTLEAAAVTKGDSIIPEPEGAELPAILADDDGDPSMVSTLSGDADAALTAQAVSLNDPGASSQWSLNAISVRDAWTLARCKTNASSPRRVSVAIIDSGCNVNHEDLKNNIIGTYDTVSGGKDVTDTQDHGTPVAGIIAAEANNGIGVAGVSYNAGLYIVRALHKQNGEFVAMSTDIVKAYKNIIANRVVNSSTGEKIRVVNMSLGSRRTGALGENDTAILRAIDEAYYTYDILTVSAAGNSESTMPYRCFPCDFSSGVLGVINITQRNVRDSSSNYNVGGNMTKLISAPGTDIYTTAANGKYTTKDGTSMATPCVTGVAALALAARPYLTARELKSVLCSSTNPIGSAGFSQLYGYGKINAYNAVRLAQNGLVIGGADSVYVGATVNMNCPGASGWSSSRSDVASVTKDGVVKGLKAGYTTISATVTAQGQLLKKTVAVYDATIDGPSAVAVKGTANYKIKCSIDGNWTFEISSNQAAASITETGTLTGKKEGKVTVTASLTSNPRVSVTKTVTIGSTGSSSANGSSSNSSSSNGSSSSNKNGSSGGSSADGSGNASGTTVMYRMYNPNSGEHFYTASANERDSLRKVGWRYEGEGWTAPKTSKTPVYRLYSGTDHHYTTSANERDSLIRSGWKYEGVGWYSDDAKGVPLYRQFNPNVQPTAPRNNSGSHNYTTSKKENDNLVKVGWKAEGIGWYGVKS